MNRLAALSIDWVYLVNEMYCASYNNNCKVWIFMHRFNCIRKSLYLRTIHGPIAYHVRCCGIAWRRKYPKHDNRTNRKNTKKREDFHAVFTYFSWNSRASYDNSGWKSLISFRYSKKYMHHIYNEYKRVNTTYVNSKESEIFTLLRSPKLDFTAR